MAFLLSGDPFGVRIFAHPEEVKRCAGCKMPLDRWSEKFETDQRIKGDLAISFEGIWMVSKRFKAMYDAEKLEGIEFRSLSTGQFALIAKRRVITDPIKDAIQYVGRQCEVCGTYDTYLTGTFKPLPADGETIGERELVGSRQEYSSRLFRHYWLLVGNEFAAAIHNYGLKKTVLLPMMGS